MVGGQQDAAISSLRRGFARSRAHSWFGRVMVALLIAVSALAQAPVAAHAAGPSSAPAFTALGRCLAQHKRLLIAFVLDESGSLGDAAQGRPGSDPTAQRVSAAQVAVQGLASLAGSGAAVEVLLAGFSDEFHPDGGWQALTPSSSGAIANRLEGFRTRDHGQDTDFYTAITGVQQSLATEARAGHDDPCEVVLLFTDGRFDIATHVAKPYDQNGADADAAKVTKGVAALCDPAGPMQRLRSAHGVLVTLALADLSAPSADQPDRAFLTRLATGDCGSPGAQYGASFDAANASGLVDQFDAIVSSIRGGAQRLGDCLGSAHAFDVVPAIGSFHLLADVGTSPHEVVVSSPNRGELHVAPSGSVISAPTAISVRASVTSNRFVAIDARPAPGVGAASPAWSGRWTVNYASANPGGSCQVFLFSAWKPVLRPMTLQPGRSENLVVDLVGADGKPVQSSELQAAHRVTGTISGPTGPATQLRFTPVGDHYRASYSAPSSFSGRTVTLDASFHVVVGGADVTSSPSPVTLSVAGVGTAGAAAGAAATKRRAATAAVRSSSSTNPIRVVLLALLVIVGLALALALLTRLARRRAAAFVDPSRLSTARVSVRIRRSGAPTRLTTGGTEIPLVLRDTDFAPCPVRRGRLRSFSLNELKFEAVSRRRLFAGGHGEVHLPGQYVTASGGTTLASGYTKGRVPLKLRGTWVYELEASDAGDDDEREPFVDGHVTVFVERDAPLAPQGRELVDSFNSFLGDIVFRLASHAPARATNAT